MDHLELLRILHARSICPSRGRAQKKDKNPIIFCTTLACGNLWPDSLQMSRSISRRYLSPAGGGAGTKLDRQTGVEMGMAEKDEKGDCRLRLSCKYQVNFFSWYLLPMIPDLQYSDRFCGDWGGGGGVGTLLYLPYLWGSVFLPRSCLHLRPIRAVLRKRIATPNHRWRPLCKVVVFFFSSWKGEPMP